MIRRIVFSVVSSFDNGKSEPKVLFSRVVEVDDLPFASSCGVLVNRVPYDDIIDSLHFLFRDLPHCITIKVSERS